MLSRRQLFSLLGLVFFTRSVSHAQQEPVPVPVPTPTPVTEAITKAEALVAEGRFGTAVSALERKQKELTAKLTDDEKRALAVALADVHFAWGLDLQKQAKWQEAIVHYQSAFALDKTYRTGDAAADLNNIGVVYTFQGDTAKALEFHNQALALRRASGDLGGEARTLYNLGKLHFDKGELPKALELYNQALPLRKAAADKPGEARTLGALLALWQDARFPQRSAPIAVAYGKLAANLYQLQTEGLRSVDRGTAKSPVLTIEGTLRLLSENLLLSGRGHEAYQVLERVKTEQYLTFQPQDRNSFTEDRKELAMTQREQVLSVRLDVGVEAFSLPAVELGALSKKPQRTPADVQKIQELQQQVAAGHQTFQKTVNTTLDELRQPGVERDKLEDMTEVQALQTALKALEPGQVVVTTLAADESLYLLAISSQQVTTHTVKVRRSELQQTVQQLRALLQNTAFDPRPTAKKLYDWLLAPLEQELRDAKHLFLVPDPSMGTISYAALYDGTRYVVEKWSTSVLSPPAQVKLEQLAPKTKALAVTQGEPQPGIPSYPGLAQEARTIGQSILANLDFTQDGWLEALRSDKCDLCHVASPFILQGPESEWGIQLGDGKKLTLETLRTLPTDAFAGLTLLTFSGLQLSPAETERTQGLVENLATLAQRKGARAVLANLWNVSDSASTLLMTDFYRRWKQDGSKVSALRDAQLAILRGETKPGELKIGPQLRAPAPPRAAAMPLNSPPYPAIERRLHPFYWASFVLFGNAR